MAEVEAKADAAQEEMRFGYIEDDLVLDAEFPGTDALPVVKFSYHPMDSVQWFTYGRMFNEFKQKAERVMPVSVPGAPVQVDIRTLTIRHCIQPFLKKWDLMRPIRQGETKQITHWVEVDINDDAQMRHVAWAIIEWIAAKITSSGVGLDAAAKK